MGTPGPPLGRRRHGGRAGTWFSKIEKNKSFVIFVLAAAPQPRRRPFGAAPPPGHASLVPTYRYRAPDPATGARIT